MFIHLPVDTGLFPVFGCYKYGRRAMNIGVYIFVWYMLSFLLGKYLEVEWLGREIGVYLTF